MIRLRLYVFLAAAVAAGFIGFGNAGAEQPKTQTIKPAAPVAPNANIDVVYYFMTTQRCPSCMKIESYTKEAVERTFAPALKNGSMVWKMVNVDSSENNHFIKDYQLVSKSVVLVKMKGGKQVSWKNLDKVWELLNNKSAFQSYVVKEVNAFKEKG